MDPDETDITQTTEIVCSCGWEYHAEINTTGKWQGVYLAFSCPECGEFFEWASVNEGSD